MLKASFIIILLFQFFSTAYSQKKLTVNLIADSTIDTEYISCSIDNGKKDLEFNRTTNKFIKDTLKISVPYFSEFATISIEDFRIKGDYYVYFINSKTVNFYLSVVKKDSTKSFKVIAPKNAFLIYDTVKNQIFKNLLKYVRFEREQLNSFMKKSASIFWNNDSLKNIFFTLSKKMIDKELPFLSKYSNEYFSFWYFNKSIVQVSKTYFPKDTLYLTYLKNYFLENFPDKFINSFEGKKLLKEFDFNFKLKKIAVGDRSPNFTVTDIKNNTIRLGDYNSSKYVLLHLWATWCAPCKKQMPEMVNLYNKYPKSELGIISFCTRSMISGMQKDIIKYKFNWINVFDEYNSIGDIFNTSAVPTYILINKEKRIVYLGNSIDEVSKIIL